MIGRCKMRALAIHMCALQLKRPNIPVSTIDIVYQV